MRVQMLGLCRFSYAGLGGHRYGHQTLAERKALIYDPERLRRRWSWFEAVTVPSIIGQTDEDFTLVVMTCPDLPEPYLSRLKELAAEIPAIKLELVEPQERYLQGCMEAIRPNMDGRADVIGHFRLDDDDAVALDYIASAKRDFQGAKAIWARKKRMACDYASGVVAKIRRQGLGLESRFIYLSTAALTIYLPADLERTAIHYEHWKIASLMPTLTLGQRRMFLRLIHQDNVSGEVGAGYALEDEGADYARILGERFGVDLDALDTLSRQLGPLGD